MPHDDRLFSRTFFPSSKWKILMAEKAEPVRLEVIRVDEFGEPSAWVVEGKLFGRTATGEVWSDWLRSVGASSLELDLEHPASVRLPSRR